jgi:hypothetical protein
MKKSVTYAMEPAMMKVVNERVWLNHTWLS